MTDDNRTESKLPEDALPTQPPIVSKSQVFSGSVGTVIGDNSHIDTINNNLSNPSAQRQVAHEMPPKVKPRVNLFISYRRNPSQGFVKSLHDHLIPQIDGRVFVDFETLGIGPFPTNLRQALVRCDLFVVVLSSTIFDRINEPGDWVHEEIALALQTKREIMLVLEHKTEYPNWNSLPADIQPLRAYNGFNIRYDSFAQDVERLVDKIRAWANT